MLNTLFSGLFDSASVSSVAVYQFLLCLVAALLLGIFIAWLYGRKEETTKSFLVTLAILPAIVCVVILLVNGNIGAGVAVAGAFSLVRFRSAPGSGKEISMLFMAMGTGLICGMGYIGYAVLFTLILSAVLTLLSGWNFGGKDLSLKKELRVTIPEELNYSEVFEDLMKKYTSHYELVHVKTSNMGSLYKLLYEITMKEGASEKEMIDELRTRNGNLEISIARQAMPMAGGEQL